MPKQTHRFRFLLGCLFALFLSSRSQAGLFSSHREGKVVSVEKSDLVQQVTVAGTVLPNRRTMFTPPFSAYVKKNS